MKALVSNSSCAVMPTGLQQSWVKNKLNFRGGKQKRKKREATHSSPCSQQERKGLVPFLPYHWHCRKQFSFPPQGLKMRPRTWVGCWVLPSYLQHPLESALAPTQLSPNPQAFSPSSLRCSWSKVPLFLFYSVFHKKNNKKKEETKKCSLGWEQPWMQLFSATPGIQQPLPSVFVRIETSTQRAPFHRQQKVWHHKSQKEKKEE